MAWRSTDVVKGCLGEGRLTLDTPLKKYYVSATLYHKAVFPSFINTFSAFWIFEWSHQNVSFIWSKALFHLEICFLICCSFMKEERCTGGAQIFGLFGCLLHLGTMRMWVEQWRENVVWVHMVQFKTGERKGVAGWKQFGSFLNSSDRGDACCVWPRTGG